MRDHPGTALLLASARTALLDQVVPALPGEARGTALMIARALAVAVARLENDARAQAAFEAGAESVELKALSSLLEVDAIAVRREEGGTERALVALGRRLVEAIRAGQFDPPGSLHDSLARFVEEATRAKLSESNPKALEHIGSDEAEEAP